MDILLSLREMIRSISTFEELFQCRDQDDMLTKKCCEREKLVETCRIAGQNNHLTKTFGHIKYQVTFSLRPLHMISRQHEQKILTIVGI